MNKILTRFAAAIGAATILSISSGTALAGGFLDISFNRDDFSNPQVLDNAYWPLLPLDVSNRTFTYIGETEDECVIDVVSATAGDIKMLSGGDYDGFIAQVVVDAEWAVEEFDECDLNTPHSDGDLAELTFDWYAQDDNGNIWYMGEASRDFGDECPSITDVPLGTEDWEDLGYGDYQEDCTGGSWEAGLNGAPDDEDPVIGEAGIVVPSNEPITGEPLTSGTYYMQEVAFEAEDMAKVLKLETSLSVEDGVEPGEYENCRKVKEWTLLEPGESVEHKWYCADGPGLVFIEGIGGGQTEQEVLVEMTSTE